jgi:hypothetical protein
LLALQLCTGGLLLHPSVWCSYCRYQAEPNPAEMAEPFGAETTVPDWAKRLVCRECESRNVSFVGSGSKHILLDHMSG